jgi:phenylpyruvate tautomerase PptA (4-oxalocrotonate tautomerase family)
MPIVDIDIVLGPNEANRKEMVSELANELGEIFHSSPGETWIKVQTLSANQYAENGGTQDGVYPVFVTIIKSKLSSIEEMQNEVAKITGAVAQICGRPSENIHVIYQPEGRGRVAFGGKLVL